MSDEACVLLNIDGRVATLTLNRPEVRNAFDEAVIARLTQLFEELAAREDIGAVVLRGAGKSFSAGGDANWMKRAAAFTPQQNEADALALAEMLHRLDTLPQTTIACVRGAAFGGGLGLAACCDIVIAEENTARFALSEVKLGLIPATIGPYVINAIGPRHARRYFQTGERFDAHEALRIGLAHIVTADVETQLDALLETLKSNGPQSMRAAKSLARDLAQTPVTPAIMKETAQKIAAIRAGEEAKEGLSAFLEKRTPTWPEK